MNLVMCACGARTEVWFVIHYVLTWMHRWGFSSFLPSHTLCGSASLRELLPVDNEERTTPARPAHGTLKLMWCLFCFVPKEEELISVKFNTVWMRAYSCFLPFHSARSRNRRSTQNIVPLYLLILQSPHIHVPRDIRTRFDWLLDYVKRTAALWAWSGRGAGVAA